jgi:hypothetical protein
MDEQVVEDRKRTETNKALREAALAQSLASDIPGLEAGDTPEIVNKKIDEHFDAIGKDLKSQKSFKLMDPSTWGNGDQITEEAASELKGLDKRRADAKAKAAKILDLGQTNIALDQQLSQERTQRLAMQQQLADSTLGRVEEMGLLPQQAKEAKLNISEQKELGKNSTAVENLLPPKPTAVVEVPGDLARHADPEESRYKAVG